MRTKLILLFLFPITLVFNSYGQKAMSFKKAEMQGRSFQHLDSLYKSAIHSNVNLAVFKSQEEQAELQKSYTGLFKELGAFLKLNCFEWAKPTRCFNRLYFNPKGEIDYFLYNFSENQIVPEKEKEFERLLNLFVKDYKFPLKANQNFAQCSPIKYTDF